MKDNLYVVQSALLSQGYNQHSNPRNHDKTKSIEMISGKIIGSGIGSFGKGYTALERQDLDSHDDLFVRRCFYLGLGMANFGNGIDNTLREIYQKGIHDDNLDVRRTAIMSLGMSYFGKGTDEFRQFADSNLEDPYWKIRAAVGIAYSYAFFGNNTVLKEFIDVLKNEDSPYVKVCSSWYVSLANALTGNGDDIYQGLLETGDSFFRDMSCLGIGFSHLGDQDPSLSDMLIRIAKKDPHAYVRESAFFGLSLLHHLAPTEKYLNFARDAISDDSMIVRSAIGIGLGLASYGKGHLDGIELAIDQTDPSVLSGFLLGAGLAQGELNEYLEQVVTTTQDPYLLWNYNLGQAIGGKSVDVPQTKFSGLYEFQQEINKGVMNLDRNSERTQAVKLFFPSIFYYSVFESFWWGPWVISSLGLAKMGDINES